MFVNQNQQARILRKLDRVRAHGTPDMPGCRIRSLCRRRICRPSLLCRSGRSYIHTLPYSMPPSMQALQFPRHLKRNYHADTKYQNSQPAYQSHRNLLLCSLPNQLFSYIKHTDSSTCLPTGLSSCHLKHNFLFIIFNIKLFNSIVNIFLLLSVKKCSEEISSEQIYHRRSMNNRGGLNQ